MPRRSRKPTNLAAYAGKWVALSSNRIVAVGVSLPELIRKIPSRRPIQAEPSVFLVPRRDEGPYVLVMFR